MTDAFPLFVVLAAVAALGWGAVKFGDVAGEAVDPASRRQLRRLLRIGVGVVAVILGVLALITILAATLVGTIWGTGCDPVLDPMACSEEN
jgi:membrane protein DedA with SNARE-associated domain